MSTRRLEQSEDTNVLDPAKKPGYGFRQGGELRATGFGHDASCTMAIGQIVSEGEYSTYI